VGSSIVRRRQVAKDQKVWEIKLREICMEKRRKIFVEVTKSEGIQTVGSRRDMWRDPHGLQRKSPSEERGVGKAKTPKLEALRVVDLRK
jgi:hypothetical protein